MKIISTLTILLLIMILVVGCKSKAEPLTIPNAISLLQNSSSSDQFYSVTPNKQFDFPRDHGNHVNYSTEWWYFTGNLKTEENRHFGYQLTFFRRGLPNNHEKRESKWAAENIYMGHFTLTDTTNNTFHQFEKFNRNSFNMAGSSDKHLDVWIDKWFVTTDSNNPLMLNVSAKESGISINFQLESDRDPVLQGDNGYSVKSRKENSASYYYSVPRMDTTGIISISDRNYDVKGMTWLDREWTSNGLAKDQEGWDWFGLHLDNKIDIMFYQLRLQSGNIDSTSSGRMINGKNSIQLNNENFQISVIDHWESPLTGIRYPSKWELSIPNHGLELAIHPYISNQELTGLFRYWEGAVQINGTINGTPITGSGYVELTGY